MITLDKAVIVEGKYDKIRLSNFLDALIITTDGFGIFKDTEKLKFIEKLSKEKGIVIITDSDKAGMFIRNKLKCYVTGKIYNVFLPEIKGKEKRKEKPSADGLLGIEGIDDNIIIEALGKAGVIGITENKEDKEKINKSDLYALGLSGAKNSAESRKKLYSILKIPKTVSINTFLQYINTVYDREEFKRVVEECLHKPDKE